MGHNVRICPGDGGGRPAGTCVYHDHDYLSWWAPQKPWQAMGINTFNLHKVHADAVPGVPSQQRGPLRGTPAWFHWQCVVWRHVLRTFVGVTASPWTDVLG